MKFIVDAMAGRLATWLRILGFDTTYFRTGSARELLNKAEHENRTVLTRNEELKKEHPARVVLLRSEVLPEQIRQVVEELGLREEMIPFSRCSVCNSPLQPKSKQEAKGNVPFFVYQTQEKFGYCPECERFYWEGTHHEEMVRLFQELGY